MGLTKDGGVEKATDLTQVYVCVCSTPDEDSPFPIFLIKVAEKEVNHIPFWEFNDGISLRVHSELFEKLIPYLEWSSSS